MIAQGHSSTSLIFQNTSAGLSTVRMRRRIRGLLRFQRAGPSTALDECVYVVEVRLWCRLHHTVSVI